MNHNFILFAKQASIIFNKHVPSYDKKKYDKYSYRLQAGPGRDAASPLHLAAINGHQGIKAHYTFKKWCIYITQCYTMKYHCKHGTQWGLLQ